MPIYISSSCPQRKIILVENILSISSKQKQYQIFSYSQRIFFYLFLTPTETPTMHTRAFQFIGIYYYFCVISHDHTLAQSTETRNCKWVHFWIRASKCGIKPKSFQHKMDAFLYILCDFFILQKFAWKMLYYVHSIVFNLRVSWLWAFMRYSESSDIPPMLASVA